MAAASPLYLALLAECAAQSRPVSARDHRLHPARPNRRCNPPEKRHPSPLLRQCARTQPVAQDRPQCPIVAAQLHSSSRYTSFKPVVFEEAYTAIPAIFCHIVPDFIRVCMLAPAALTSNSHDIKKCSSS